MRIISQYGMIGEIGTVKPRIVTMLMAVLYLSIRLMLWKEHDQKETSHPTRIEAEDLEEKVFGEDPQTEFVPAVYTGGMVDPVENIPRISPEDEYYKTLEMMARCVEAEAGNQGLLGKRLVVDVILNRVNDPDFPDNVREVIAQPYQFTVYWNGAMEAVEPTEETWEAIWMELKEISYPGVMYFTNEDFLQYGTPWKKIGDHYFSTK